MALADIVNVSITRTSATVSRASFDIALVAGVISPSILPDLVTTFATTTVLNSLVDAGMDEDAPTYKAVRAIVSQNPRPRRIKIGRLVTPNTQVVTLLPVVANTTVYSGRVLDQPWTFTSDGSATAAEIATGIAAAITALAGVTATGVSGTTVVITADAPNVLFNVSRSGSVGVYSVHDTTASTNLATELAAIRSADSTWYGFVIDQVSEAAIEAAAAWAETERVLFVPTSADSEGLNPASTTDVFSDLKASGYARTVPFYHEDADSFLGAATLATVLPYDAGAVNWRYRSPSGVAVSNLTETQKLALDGKFASHLDLLGGRRIIQLGRSSSGEPADITQAIDWLTARMQEDVFGFLTTSPKRTYENKTISALLGVMDAVLRLGVDRGILAADPKPFTDAPRAEEVSEIDRANRLLPDVIFTARLSGAIEMVDVMGFVGV